MSDQHCRSVQGNPSPAPAFDAQEDDARKANVSRFLKNFSLETTPAGARRIADFRQHVAEGTWVYVTSLTGSDFLDIVTTCRKLSAEGMVPVPHFAARGIADDRTLEDRLDRVTSEAGVTRVLAIAGSDREAAGRYPDTISMLETGLFGKYGIRSIGVSGHPEDPPGLEPGGVRMHEARKLDFSRASGIEMYIVTQFVFDADPVLEFVKRLRSAGNGLPVVVGLPGPATIQSLIRYAKACGIGPSLRFMTRRAGSLRKLLTVEAPDGLALQVANFAASGDVGIAGGHIYPFGGFAKSAAWANAAAAANFSLTGDGFSVDTAPAAQADRGHS